MRVAAEAGDVALYPAQGGLLVLQAVVTRLALGVGQGRVRQEPERTEPVVDGHHGYAVLNQLGGVVIIAFAGYQRAAVDPHHDRVARTRLVTAWREDVQEEAVLRRAGLAEGRRRLRAVRRELGRLAHARPAGGGLRRLPPQRADRWRGVRKAEKFIDCPVSQTADRAVGGVRQRPAWAGGRLPREGLRAHRGPSRGQGRQGESGYGQPGECPPSSPSHEHVSLPHQKYESVL